MPRADNGLYARFEDSVVREKAERSGEGMVELGEGNPDGHCNKNADRPCADQRDIEKQEIANRTLAEAVRKIYVCLLVICIVVIILFIFTATNFVLIMQSRDNMAAPQTSSSSDQSSQFHLELRDDIEKNSLDKYFDEPTANDTHPCEVYVGLSCYWISASEGSNYIESVPSCLDKEGEPGNVYGDNYDTILKLIRRYSSINVTSVWLGMTRDPETEEIFFHNHDKSDNTLHWLPGYPGKDPDAVNLCLRGDENPNSTETGFMNLNPRTRERTQGILCEKPWDNGFQYDNDVATDLPSLDSSSDFDSSL